MQRRHYTDGADTRQSRRRVPGDTNSRDSREPASRGDHADSDPGSRIRVIRVNPRYGARAGSMLRIAVIRHAPDVFTRTNDVRMLRVPDSPAAIV